MLHGLRSRLTKEAVYELLQYIGSPSLYQAYNAKFNQNDNSIKIIPSLLDGTDDVIPTLYSYIALNPLGSRGQGIQPSILVSLLSSQIRFSPTSIANAVRYGYGYKYGYQDIISSSSAKNDKDKDNEDNNKNNNNKDSIGRNKDDDQVGQNMEDISNKKTTSTVRDKNLRGEIEAKSTFEFVPSELVSSENILHCPLTLKETFLNRREMMRALVIKRSNTWLLHIHSEMTLHAGFLLAYIYLIGTTVYQYYTSGENGQKAEYYSQYNGWDCGNGYGYGVSMTRIFLSLICALYTSIYFTNFIMTFSLHDGVIRYSILFYFLLLSLPIIAFIELTILSIVYNENGGLASSIMTTYLSNSLSSIVSTIKPGPKQKDRNHENISKKIDANAQETFFSKFDSALGNTMTKAWSNNDYISLHEKEMDMKKKDRKSRRGIVGAFLHALYHKEDPELLSTDMNQQKAKPKYDTNFQSNDVYNEEKMEEKERLLED